jgi:DDE superfamily endonuclease
MTHWSTRSLARVARRRRIAPAISHSTVAVILRDAQLQPHRSRYWKTATPDEDFHQKAARIVWCYERAHALAERGEVVLCLDEKPNIQVLERRCPTRRMKAGLIQKQEFEYKRHGTVNFLAKLVVHTGRMRGWCLERNDAAHLIAVLPQLLEEHGEARRIHLIWDGGSSHVARQTRSFLAKHYPQVRVLVSPAHASWLNQAELLLRAFAARYLHRGSWTSRAALIAHLDASWPEYNRLYAHPFTWSWTRSKLHEWVTRRSS